MTEYNNTTVTNKFKYGITGLTVLIAALYSMSGLPARAATDTPEYNFMHYTSDKGLPSNCVRDIAQDSKGLIWFATDGGVCSFDGVRFHTYLPGDSEGKEPTDSYALSLCMYGNELLVSASQNLYRYDRIKDKIVPLDIKYPQGVKMLNGLDVRDMESDSFGNIWLAVENNGIYCMDHDMKVTAHYDFPELNNTISSIYVDSSNTVWGLSTVGEGGVYRFDRNSKRFRKLIFGRFYYLIFQTGASRQNLIKPRLSAFVSCKINDLV